MGEAAISGHLGHSNHKVVEFKIFGDRKKNVTRTSILDLEIADFRMLRELVSKVPQEAAFEDTVAHQ